VIFFAFDVRHGCSVCSDTPPASVVDARASSSLLGCLGWSLRRLRGIGPHTHQPDGRAAPMAPHGSWRGEPPGTVRMPHDGAACTTGASGVTGTGGRVQAARRVQRRLPAIASRTAS